MCILPLVILHIHLEFLYFCSYNLHTIFLVLLIFDFCIHILHNHAEMVFHIRIPLKLFLMSVKIHVKVLLLEMYLLLYHIYIHSFLMNLVILCLNNLFHNNPLNRSPIQSFICISFAYSSFPNLIITNI